MNKDRKKNDPMVHLLRLQKRASAADQNIGGTSEITKRSWEKVTPLIPVTGSSVGVDKYIHNKGNFKP